MVVYLKWNCPLCGLPNGSRRVVAFSDREDYDVVECEGCSHPTVLGVTAVVEAHIYRLSLMSGGNVEIKDVMLKPGGMGDE